MLLEDDELLPIFIEYMQSDNVNLMNEACWVISNIVNCDFVDIVMRVVQADHCFKCCIDVMNKIEDENLANQMKMALQKCFMVVLGSKE